MTRRLPADGNVANRRTLLTLTILLLAWLVDAQQQHQQPKSSRIRDYVPPQDGISVGSVSTLEATTLARARQPVDVVRDNEEYKQNEGYHGADAEMTALPRKTVDVKAVIPAVRAPTSRRSGILGNADLTLQNARSLDDWEVEDFVLMADVEGRVFARDRKTGKHRWVLDIDRPIVEAEYMEQNVTGGQRVPIDESVWMVEPSGDGPLYIYVPGGPQTGLLNTGLSMKKLVEMAPHSEGDFVFVGEKQTQLLTVSALDGRILQWFGTKTKYNRAAPTCGTQDGFDMPDSEECTETGTITLGRTEYTVEIQRSDGHPVVTLKYAEWGPNNFNKDLLGQHKGSMDGKYWYSRHDGSVFAFAPERNDGRQNPMLYNARLESPVVRVFDVARPIDSESANPELIVLPQPPAPPTWEQIEGDTQRRNTRIFVNKTKLDQLYVLSGKTYPLVVDGPKHAECDREDFWQWLTPDSHISHKRLKEALVGLHSVDGERPKPLLTIGAPPVGKLSSEVKNDEPVNPTIPILEPMESVIDQMRSLPAAATNSATEWVNNPFTMIMSISLFIWWMYQKRRQIVDTISKNGVIRQLINAVSERSYHPETIERERVAHAAEAVAEPAAEPAPLAEKKTLPLNDAQEVVDQTPVPKLASLDGANDEPEQNVEAEMPEGNGAALQPIAEGTETPGTTPSPPPKVAVNERTNAEGSRKRGKRGGKKKNKNKSDSQASHPSNMAGEPETVEGAIANARKFGEPKAMEPDIVTIPTAVSEITGPILRINNLEVNTEKLIGTGSNGTMVFEGKLGGRVVAVKRMLIQFFEIASHETRLLEESDIHPNVVRYYVQQQSQGFLYIALELCSASLADVIERPNNHRELAQRGEKNTPNILYQITNGLRHLHNLRIVHRDLKPQNILVTMGADGNPRMLVSDFGLCKKLEGEQSSFRATTAHAAGTTGWRAPELLLDDDARHDKPLGFQEPSSHMSETGSGPLVSTDLLPTRRATRAIDIFSLGLVFFYVLSRGLHPYDCGDRYMREVNIRKGTFNLSPLDALGDDSYEAKDLIAAMLRHEPKERPTAAQVMAHPFFWSRERRLDFLCDVSDYFEKEVRDPPSPPLQILERNAEDVTHGDFLKYLGKEFLDSLGKQRKYTGSRMLDLLRALRNKKYHYEDMCDSLKAKIGKLPEGYLSFWTQKFPNLIITCWEVVREAEWEGTDRFRKYYAPLPPGGGGQPGW